MYGFDTANLIYLGILGVMIICVVISLLKGYDEEHNNDNERIDEFNKQTKEEDYEWKSRHNTL